MNTNKIINIVAWGLLILGVIFIVWKLIGGSPTEFNILITLISGILFKIMGIGNDVSGLKERVRNIENQFKSLASDFKEHIRHK